MQDPLTIWMNSMPECLICEFRPLRAGLLFGKQLVTSFVQERGQKKMTEEIQECVKLNGKMIVHIDCLHQMELTILLLLTV